MAASRLHPSFRHDGHIFFIYDHRVKTEEDDPSDAILYFYPATVTTEQQIAIVGGIIGITDFCLEFLPQSMPTIVKLNGHNFALLQHEEFIIGLAGGEDIPDNFLISHMQFVWSTFILYQGSLGAIRARVSDENFVKELGRIWDMYLPLCQIHSDPLSQAFKVLPYVQLHKSQGSLYLHASHILQRTLRYKGVVAGALFSWKKVLCSQLSNSLTRQLLLLMTQSQFPCVEANSVLELPGGVRLLHVFLPDNEYSKLSHRRKKAYKIPSHPMTAAAMSWAGKPLVNSKQSGVKGADYNTSTSSVTLSESAGRTVQISEARLESEAYSTASESVRRGSKGRWSNSLPRRDSGLSTAAAGALTSGTDSEVFVDTFDNIQVTPAAGAHQYASHAVGAVDPDDRARNRYLYVPPCGNSSSSEQNSPVQKPLRVFAEVHADTTGSPVEVAPLEPTKQRKDSRSKKLSESEEVLVFGQQSDGSKDQRGFRHSTGSTNINVYKTGVDEHTFSSISNLKTGSEQKEKSNSSLKPKVVEAIVDFIYPSSGQKKPQVISKAVVPNGILPVARKDEVKEDLNKCESSTRKNSLSVEKSPNSRSETSDGSASTLFNCSTDVAHGSSTAENLDVESRPFSKGEVLDSSCSNQSVLVTETDRLKSVDLSSDFIAQTKAVSNVMGSENLDTKPLGHVDTLYTDPAENKTALDTLQPERQENCINIESFKTDQSSEDIGQLSSVKSGEKRDSSMSLPENCEHLNSEDEPLIKASAESKGGEITSLSKANTSADIRQQSEKDSNIQQAVAQSKHEIDASLEVRLSGDESSTHSSSEQRRLSMISSTLSLAAGELGPAKMRLTFEGQESENSDPGIMSPMSEVGRMHDSVGGRRLPPVKETTKNNRKGEGSFDGVDGDCGMRRLSSDFESRHVRSDSIERQGGKSPESSSLRESQSPLCDVQENETTEPATSAENNARRNPGRSKLHKMTLYAQGHSDTLLLLLLSKSASCSKGYINSLWKTCLSHLAELDFEVKDAERHLKDDSENLGAAYQYMRYDSFSQSLKGSALLPVSSLANEIVDTCVKMHDTFDSMPDVQDITYRSHSACCYGHRAINTETYFQLHQPRNAAGICAQNDRTFSLEQLAGRILKTDVKMSIL